MEFGSFIFCANAIHEEEEEEQVKAASSFQARPFLRSADDDHVAAANYRKKYQIDYYIINIF